MTRRADSFHRLFRRYNDEMKHDFFEKDVDFRATSPAMLAGYFTITACRQLIP